MKNISIKYILIIFVYLSFLNKPVLGFEYTGRRWPSNGMPTFYVNQAGTPDCSNEFEAIQNSINTWNDVTTAYNRFTYSGTTANNNYATYDGTNLIMWVESNWTDMFSSNDIGVTVTWYGSGTIYETDISLNGEYDTWSDNGSAGKMDVQDIVTHELGHSVGLADLYGGSDVDKTMYGYSDNGETKKRSLETDDENGTRYIYFNPQTSGSLSENQVWLDNLDNITVTLSGDLSIPSGYSCLISSNYTANLNGHSIILTGGTINVEVGATISGLAAYLKDGTTIKGYCSSIQSAVDNSSSGQTIELLATTYNITVNITDLDNRIIKGQGTGTVINGDINLTYSSYIYIQDLKLGEFYRISATNSYPIISNLNTDNDDATSISLYGYGGADIDSWSSNGFDTIDPDLLINASSGTTMQNSDITGQETAAYVSNGASFHSDNNYYCSNGMDIWVQSGMAHAVDNTFSRDPSSSNYGYVVYGGTSSICEGGMPKRNILASNIKNYMSDPAYSDYTFADSLLLELIVKVNNEARTNKNTDLTKYKSEYDNVINKFKNVLVNYPESDLAKYILSKIAGSYIRIKDFEGLRNYIGEITKDKKYGTIKQYADRQMVSCYTSIKDYEKAIGAANEVMTLNNLDTELTDELLYEKGIIYEYILNNNQKAEECFSSIVKNNVSYDMINLASYQLKNMGLAIGKKISASSTSAKGKVELSNYPNPFNPTTTISYTLKERDHITLIVFDILGKEVTRLVDGIQTEGEHSINFDGSSLPSGIYIYRLTGTNFNISKKMLLIK